VQKTTNYKITEIPYPYTSAEQYEKAMAGSLGADWNTTEGVRANTREEVVTRVGKIIDPISRQMKQKEKAKNKRETRPGAKF